MGTAILAQWSIRGEHAQLNLEKARKTASTAACRRITRPSNTSSSTYKNPVSPTGLSIIAFGVGLLADRSSRMPFTAASALVFGVSMMSNGIFVMGGPLHGLYGIGLAAVLVPAFFAAEFPRGSGTRGADTLSLSASTLVLIYMWMLMTGLDPVVTKGLTQRLACVPMFGWFSYASLKLLGYWSPSTRSTPAGRSISAEPLRGSV